MKFICEFLYGVAVVYGGIGIFSHVHRASPLVAWMLVGAAAICIFWQDVWPLIEKKRD